MSGIYCIKVNDAIVYVGKAKDINDRIRKHYADIRNSNENKYQLLRDCGWPHTTFWLLEENVDPEKIDEKERMWINVLKPCLNSKFNNQMGLTLSAKEFVEIITYNSDFVEGMKPYTYIKYKEEK